MKPKISFFFLIAFLTACAAPELSLFDQTTGETGKGTAQGAMFGSMGAMSLAVGGDAYSGTWVAMRDSGYQNLTFFSPGPKDGGIGIANLRSQQGKIMRCEFGYSMSSMSGIGLCKRNDGRMYDLMMKLM